MLVQAASAWGTIAVLLLAFCVAGVVPFAIPISLLHHRPSGSWGYLASLAGMGLVIISDLWWAAIARDRLGIATTAICLTFLAVLAVQPDGRRWHEPAACLIGLCGILWMFARVGSHRLAPWLALGGIPLLLTMRDPLVAIGEALLLTGWALCCSRAPVAVDRRPIPPGTRWWQVPSVLWRNTMAPVLGHAGLPWAMTCVGLGSVAGSFRDSFWLGPVCFLVAYLTGRLASRWEGDLLVTAVLRFAPLFLLLKAAPTNAATVVGLIAFLGAYLMVSMARILAD